MPIACADPHVFIWGIKEQATPGQEEMVVKAKSLLQHLEDTGVDILITSVSLGELLMRIPLDQHPMMLDRISKSFIVADFDARAASIFAEIWQQSQSDGVIEELKASENTRDKIKADCQILATAIANGARIVYSNDDGMKKLARNRINVAEIQGVPSQLDLEIIDSSESES